MLKREKVTYNHNFLDCDSFLFGILFKPYMKIIAILLKWTD